MKKILVKIWTIYFSFIFFIFFYFFSVYKNFFGIFGVLPSFESLENPKDNLSSEVYSCDGILLGRYYRYNRSVLSFEEIPKNFIDALISTEDTRFRNHYGLDIIGIFRAAILSVILRQKKGGGSTITQQLAKNLFNLRSNQKKSFLEKIPIIKILITKTKEWIVAIELERSYTKDEILKMYINTSCFGNNSYGLKIASNNFFSKKAIDLSIEESALLVGILKAPTYYSPIKNKKRSFERRNLVLKNMLKNNLISKDLYENSIKQPINLNLKKDDHTSGIATYFRSFLKNYLVDWCKENGYDLFEDGLKIYTTIDSKIQIYAEKSVSDHMKNLQDNFDKHWNGENPWRYENGEEIENFIKNSIKKTDLFKELKIKFENDEEKIFNFLNTKRKVELFSWQGYREEFISPLEELAYNKKFLHSGMIVLDTENGEIKAWVGGIDFNYFKFDNVKQSLRQTGSVFKSIVFAAAIDIGYMPWDFFYDSPVTFITNDENGSWTPQNWSNNFSGEQVSMRYACAKSLNSVIAFLTKEISPESIVYYCKKFGIKRKIPALPSICLGAAEVSLLEIASAYSSFSNSGIIVEPNFILKIEDKNGKCIKKFNSEKKEAISKETAYLMIYLLRGTTEMKDGLYKSIPKDIIDENQVACKSGTSQNQSDGTFIALTKNLCVGIWVGGQDRSIHFKDLASGSGSKMARPIWEIFIRQIYQDKSLSKYQKGKIYEKIPEGLKEFENELNN